MPTRAGWFVLAGAVAAAVAGRAFGTLELYVFAALAGALVILAVAWVRRPVPAVVVERRVVPVRPTASATARVELEVRTTSGRAPVTTLVDPVEGTVGARLTVGPVPAGARLGVGYRLPTRRRGHLTVGPLVAERTDPFGLARRREVAAPAVTVTILPRLEPLTMRATGGGRTDPLEGASQRALAAVAAEDLATLRPYVVGDDLRRVHWRSSAHAGDLVVRRDEERWQGHATVLVDCRRAAADPDAFERVVSAAASLVHAIAGAGDRVRLVTTAGLDSGMVDARRAEPVLMEELALVAQHDGPGVVPSPPEGRGSETLVVLSGHDGEGLPATTAFTRRVAFDLSGGAVAFAERWREAQR